MISLIEPPPHAPACLDCKFHKYRFRFFVPVEELHLCLNPRTEIKTLDLVLGTRTTLPPASCYSQRTHPAFGRCGPAANFFEPKHR